jgi:hypothetical protein
LTVAAADGLTAPTTPMSGAVAMTVAANPSETVAAAGPRFSNEAAVSIVPAVVMLTSSRSPAEGLNWSKGTVCVQSPDRPEIVSCCNIERGVVIIGTDVSCRVRHIMIGCGSQSIGAAQQVWFWKVVALAT